MCNIKMTFQKILIVFFIIIIIIYIIIIIIIYIIFIVISFVVSICYLIFPFQSFTGFLMQNGIFLKVK